MDVNAVKADSLPKEENGVLHQENGIGGGSLKFGSHNSVEPKAKDGNNIIQTKASDGNHVLQTEANDGNNALQTNYPRDAIDEWPTVHSFYFVKYRQYTDPKLKAKLEKVDADIQKKNKLRSQIFEQIRAKKIGSLVLLLLWHILHAIVNLLCFVRRVYHVLESSLIDSDYLKMYRDLNLDSLHNLAIVVDSEEAHKTLEVIQLLQWVAAIGVRNVCLYDTKGVLKKSKEIILEKLCVPKVSEDGMAQLLEQKAMNLEFASLSDGKEAVARAANVLLAKHYLGGETAPLFTESHVAEALMTVGSGGPNPELLLVYGPARCHQGFPSWRIRYTEIIHMGPLESMNHGSLIKAMWKFSNVHQNYGK